MNCFMGYNPLVAKEVKITTWIKEFDGDSPVYPSFPNDGDCFVVFATDEDALTHNALSKKTYTNGDWADAEGGGGGGGDFSNPTKIDYEWDADSSMLVTTLTADEVYLMLPDATPYLEFSETDVETYMLPYMANTRYMLSGACKSEGVVTTYDFTFSAVPTLILPDLNTFAWFTSNADTNTKVYIWD